MAERKCDADIHLVGYEKWRVIDVVIRRETYAKIGLWRLVWGADIFVNDIPILKCFALINIIVWVSMYFALR